MDMIFDEGPFYPKIFNDNEKMAIRSHKLWRLVQHLHINSGGELRVASITSDRRGVSSIFVCDELMMVDKTGYAVFLLRQYLNDGVLENFNVTAIDYPNLKKRGLQKHHLDAKNIGYLIKRLPADLIMKVVKRASGQHSDVVETLFHRLENSIENKLRKLYDPRAFREFTENLPYDRLAALFESVMNGDTIDKMSDSMRDMVTRGDEKAQIVKEYNAHRNKTLSSVFGKNGAYVFSVGRTANFFCMSRYLRIGDSGYRCEQPMVAYRSLDSLPADCVDHIKFSLLTCKMNRGDPLDTAYIDNVLPRSLSGANFYEDTNSFYFNNTPKLTTYFVVPA